MSDNVFVTKYDIFMNGIKCKTGTTETMEEIIVTVPGGTYSFFVRAYDAANNYSDSPPVSPQGTGVQIVTQEEIQRFINQYNATYEANSLYGPLTSTQIQALNKINDYADSEIVQGLGADEPLLLYFEGAGNDKGDTTYKGTAEYSMHDLEIGRFGAMIIVVKNGTIVYASPNASTLPDAPTAQYGTGGMGHATVKPGVYYIDSEEHSGYPGFASGINPNPDNISSPVPVFRVYNGSGVYDPDEYTGSGCDLHPGTYCNNESTGPNSTGCTTVGYRPYGLNDYPNDYESFATACGLSVVTYEPTYQYGADSSTLPWKRYRKEPDGTYVQDNNGDWEIVRFDDQIVKYGDVDSNGNVVHVVDNLTGAFVIDRTLADKNELLQLYRTFKPEIIEATDIENAKAAVDYVMGVDHQ